MKQIKRIIGLTFLIVMSITTLVLGNDINSENYKYECRIGPIGVRDTFDMSQLNTLFGSMTSPVTQQRLGVNNSIRLMDLNFGIARVCVLNDYIATLTVKSNYAEDGEALGTPRGIVVGHDLDTVFRLYGTPLRTWNSKNNSWVGHNLIMYSYGSYEYGLTFGVNPSTNRVETIGIFIPTC